MSDVKTGANESISAGRRWFENYIDVLENHSTIREPGEELYPCPCCGEQTLGERGGFEICDVCGWEDDGQDDHDADVVRGGPNGSLSLSEARARRKASVEFDKQLVKRVRPSQAEEM